MPCQAFALLAAPKFLYAPGGMPSSTPMVRLRVVFIPPYFKKISFTDAYFLLNQWVRVGSEPLQQEQVMFLHSSPMSSVGPHLQPYPMWMGFAVRDTVKEHAPLHSFQAFCLHQIVAVAPDKPSGVLAPYVYTPHCEDREPFLEPYVPESVPVDLTTWVYWDIGVAEPTEFH